MFDSKKFTSAAILAATIALTTLPMTATAQPQNNQRGLVNVAVFEVIDDVTIVIKDVNVVAVGVAANIAANVCGVGIPVAVLAQQVIVGGGEVTCTNDTEPVGVTISQQ